MQRSLDNATPIATIANLDSVWILGDVFERDLGTVRSAQSVDVTLPAYPGETLHGRISNISDAMDPTSRTLKVRVVMPNPRHLLKPEMFATLSIARTTAQQFVRAHNRGRSRRFLQLRFPPDFSGEVRAPPGNHRNHARQDRGGDIRA